MKITMSQKPYFLSRIAYYDQSTKTDMVAVDFSQEIRLTSSARLHIHLILWSDI